ETVTVTVSGRRNTSHETTVSSQGLGRLRRDRRGSRDGPPHLWPARHARRSVRGGGSPWCGIGDRGRLQAHQAGPAAHGDPPRGERAPSLLAKLGGGACFPPEASDHGAER